jgi:hypothetical protein
MQVGEEGYCSIDAMYVAPSSPPGPNEGHDVGMTARFLLPEAELYSEPSPMAKVHIRRLEDGFAITLPPGEVASRYRRCPVPGSLPVIATD